MLLLASASPARRRLLEQAAIPHRVRVSGVAEEDIVETDPVVLVQRLAQAKATAVRSWLLAAGAQGLKPGEALEAAEAEGATTTVDGVGKGGAARFERCWAVIRSWCSRGRCLASQPARLRRSLAGGAWPAAGETFTPATACCLVQPQGNGSPR